MARNDAPQAAYAVCGQPATWLCMDCWYESDEAPMLCDEHVEEHEHEEGLMAYANSPRTGMCGYSGPAEPPY